MLALLLLGSYIPVGFMPAAGTPFLLELCPVASPMSLAMAASMPWSMHAHHHSTGGTHGHVESCPFGSAPSAGPLSQHIVFALPPRADGPFDAIPDSTPIAGRTPRSHRARAPPSPV